MAAHLLVPALGAQVRMGQFESMTTGSSSKVKDCFPSLGRLWAALDGIVLAEVAAFHWI